MIRTKSFDNNGPILYLIATPIGNLSEISQRALDTLKEMDLIAAEDTRNTHLLLSKYGIRKDVISLREHNEVQVSLNVIKLLKEGKKVAYVSDAGYPGISDPGAILVSKAIQSGIKVSTISGSSAFLNALVSSGLPTEHFFFYGFLSPKEKEASDQLSSLKEMRDTLIFYESPHRLFKTLKVMEQTLGNREIVLARELTKINEEFIRGTIQEILSLEKEGLKGEMVIIVSGSTEQKIVDDSVLIKRVEYLMSKGMSRKDAIEVASEDFGINKNYIYKIVHQ
ncbi:MAG TPA: 16S rRNA (cytidine(1402)-2'-O)-methyltransferase [Bacilli bacterium]|nr:16S rRNA (cytidine(1402)-2'-O)-methyltransferase [Bacilli bacterium]HPS18555.1 16S rRNA (cytidine(1402)-2'-O)-methyltransferase [Bacilli bacterium]